MKRMVRSFLLALCLLPAGHAAAQEGGRAPRAIAPDIIAVPPVDPDTLERTEPRTPLSGIGQARPPGAPDAPLLFRPVATAAGRIEAGGREIVIAGIRIIEPEQRCDAPDGTWPCGMRARTAFRSWLRGRAVECARPGEGEPEQAARRCSLGGRDIGAWLVAQGWALAEDGGAYEEEEQAAREGRKGIFGTPPGSGGAAVGD